MTTTTQERPTAMITGASSGIGAELVRIFASQGYDLVLVARSKERLDLLRREVEDKFQARARVMISDLAVPGAAGRLHEQTQAAELAIDVLVNGAGFGMHGPFLELDSVRQSEMIQVNLVALTELTHLAATDMAKRGRGRILNIASTAAFQPGPLMAVYCATKAYVFSFSEALANELRGTGVTVTCLCPGPTATAFAEAARAAQSGLFSHAAVMSSEAVAQVGYHALQRGADLAVPGLRNRLLALSTRFAPARVAASMARRLIQNR